MGCGGSKLEEEAAVSLCRERSQFLADAIRYRYALADAHAAYARSLAAVGAALQGFLPGSHVLPLPTQRKGDPLPPLTPSPPPPTVAAAAASVPSAAVHGRSHSRSHSGSHIRFHPSGSESDDDLSLHSDGDSPIHHLPEDEDYVGKTHVNLNYARNRPPQPSVSYEQRPPGAESVRFGSVDEPAPAAYPYYDYPYPPQSSSFYPPYPSYPDMNYGGGLFGSSSPPPNIPPPAGAAGGRSVSPDPPPPPSPKASTWEFLNPFESYDNYYAPYTPSRSSRELREEEGIPDLEDEDQEVVKEAYGDKKFGASTSAPTKGGEHSGKAAMGLKDGAMNGEDPHRRSRSVETGSSSEHEVHVVEKNVIHERAERRPAGFAVSRSYHNDADVVQEIKAQFDRASQSADQLSKMLEVGKLLYHQKNSVYEVTIRMICGFPTFPTSNNEEPLVFEEDKAMDCGNLSSTLQKLYNWERKLIEEVVAEEKMRVLYDRKRQQLSHLSERGAEAEKIEAVETSIRKLSTKIRIAIQVVDTIASKISQLRDEELWPQVRELIQGFWGMWREMSECHHIQCQAISEAKNLDSILSGAKVADANMGAVKHLELVMVDWITNFSAWVSAQRCYVKSLNCWLTKGIHYEPEVTDDGPVPFSPGRLGAPPVFVVCNSWWQTMEMVSERDVVEATQAFIDNIFNIWNQHKVEQQQRLLATKDTDGKLRLIEREEQEMLKQKKKLMLISTENGISIPEHVLHQESTSKSLLSSLRQIFEAVDNFAANTTKAYEALQARAEEEKQRLARENARIS